MNGHVEEEAARDANIFNGRWRGVTTDDMEQIGLADLSLFYGLAHPAIVGIKAPIEADLEFDASAFHRVQGLVDGWQIKGDGFFAEDMLAYPCGFLDDLSVSIGGRADHYR